MRRGSVQKVSFFAVSSLNKCCFAVQLTKSGTITLPNNGFGRCVTRNCRARRSAISLPAGGNTEANGAGELLSKLLHFNSIRRRRTPILRVVEPAPNETCPTPTVQTPSPHYLRRRIFAYVLHSALGGKVYAHAGGSARFRECWMASDNRLLSATLQRIIGKKHDL